MVGSRYLGLKEGDEGCNLSGWFTVTGGTNTRQRTHRLASPAGACPIVPHHPSPKLRNDAAPPSSVTQQRRMAISETPAGMQPPHFNHDA